MSDTPRPDAAKYSTGIIGLCRTLEQELKASQAEVERLQNGFQGSCYCCEPVGVLNQNLEAEVERLKAKLYRAIEIADEFWNNQKQAVLVYHQELADELGQLKSTFNQEKK